MRRGFKALSERMAEEARREMGLAPTAKLDPWDYSEKLGLIVMGADELDLPPAHREQLLVRDIKSWSGMTLREDGITLIVLNSAQSKKRQCSTLMHELAHHVLEHAPATVEVSPTGMLLLSDYSDDQEDEADWLMGALLLPRAALLRYRTTGKTPEYIANQFGVSDDLCKWRLRMTGVEAQLRHRL